MPPASAGLRGPSARELMKLSWIYAVHVGEQAPKSDATAVKAPRRALPRDQALAALAGDDPRPLLVLRECAVCNKTDDALLKPGIDNEKTLFLARFFRCVKLPVDVLQPDHPFHVLFPDKKSEHLFVSSPDGTRKIPLESDTSRIELWEAMSSVLAAHYTKDPLEAFKANRIALDKLDQLDQRLNELEGRRSELLEDPSAEKAKARKVDVEIEKTKQRIAEAREQVARTAEIPLKAEAARPAKAGSAGL
jgi:hypothetical protein